MAQPARVTHFEERKKVKQDPIHQCYECLRLVKTRTINRIGRCPYCGSQKFKEVRYMNTRQALRLFLMGADGREMLREFENVSMKRFLNALARLAERMREWDDGGWPWPR